ncbi:guanylate kinase [Malonomonas rubra DSM 5091]|uniref:Guanylate kinase n=1 Tax=Malonomonas rubra DSM 5091 TaxID=1122189 RepID=A0A1M6DP60_MALRU|nr:guanylate kinase [Malonomonas rubra]SHI74943.1 guanylate kinase [Malonomonas rubra DSM 5091]
MSDPVREGVLFVVSAPSGAGKTSLCRELIDRYPELRQSVSFTTRQPRSGEVEGKDYHFVEEDVFRQMVAENKLAEWAEVHGNCYGTSLNTLQTAAEQGVDLLLDIDFQGAAQLKQNYQHGVFVFILPPDFAELERRLRGRDTDSDEVIEKRLKNARREISEAGWYDYLVVNDDFQTALDQLSAIVQAERCRSQRNQQTLAKLTGE